MQSTNTASAASALPREHTFNLAVRALTHPGVIKKDNEDRLSINGWETSEAMNAPRSFELSTAENPYVLLADGMGGRVAGAIASATAVQYISEHLGNVEEPGHVAQLLIETNQFLHAIMLPETAGMGTTVAGLKLLGPNAIFFNVGDSRIYVADAEGAQLISTDDTVSAALGMPKRSSRLTQVLGGSDPMRRVVPHVGHLELKGGTKLLLCSDGISDLIDDNEIYETLAHTGTDDAQRLAEIAFKRGGHDDISAIVIDIPSRLSA